MWIALVVGAVIYKLLRGLFQQAEEFGPEAELRLKITVGNRLEKVYGGEVYSALRIPDEAGEGRENIDMVHLTERELSVIAVRNYSGLLDVANDGCWTKTDMKGQSEKLPNPVEETRHQAAILESYLERRGIVLPPGYLNCKVVLANANSKPLFSVNMQPEVLSYEKWMQLTEESRGGFRSWLKRKFSGVKHEAHNEIHRKLRFILSSAPTWDRLELKGNQQMLGEFLGFKGKEEAMEALKAIKRSKVSKVVNYRPMVFDLLGDAPNVYLFCTVRDYRHGDVCESDRIEVSVKVSVKSGVEVAFRPMHVKKVQRYKIQRMVSLSLSP